MLIISQKIRNCNSNFRKWRLHHADWSNDLIGGIAACASLLTAIPLATLGLGWGWAPVTVAYLTAAVAGWLFAGLLKLDNVTRPRGYVIGGRRKGAYK